MKRTALIIFLMFITINVFSQRYVFDSIPENLKKRADAVMRTDQCLYTIEKPGYAVMKIKQAITLLNEDADSYRQVLVYYDNYSRVTKLLGTVYDSKGNVVEVLGPSDVQDLSAISGGTFYSDDRYKEMYFPIYKYPYTIEYEYEVSFTSIINYRTWYFQSDPNVSVQKSGIQFIVPENMELRYFEEYMNCDVDSVNIDGKNIYTWQEENLPAYQSEDYSFRTIYHDPVLYATPLDFEYGGYKGSMRSWKDFGSWIYEINKDRNSLPQTEIDAIEEIVGKTDNQKEKVRLVYEYMQSKTRYVSIQIGIGGYRSAEASDVAKNGFGDCKALVNYTLSLLKTVGIDSYLTLVNTGTIYDINTDFVFNSFNHVILCVPVESDTVWLECTNPKIPANYLGTFTAGKHALVITPEGGKMVKTPEFGRYGSLQKRTGEFNINFIGGSSGNISNYYSGSFYGPASGKYSLQSEDEIERMLFSSYRYDNFNISSHTYSENKSEDPSATLSYRFNINNYAVTNDQMIYFNPTLSLERYMRDVPCYLKITESVNLYDSIVYNLPPNYIIDYMPENVNIENEFGRFVYKLNTSGDKILYERIFELEASEIDIEKYNEFRMFINTVAKTDRDKVILKKYSL